MLSKPIDFSTIFRSYFPLRMQIDARKKCLQYLLFVYIGIFDARNFPVSYETQWAWNVTSQVIVNHMQTNFNGMEYWFSFVGKLVPFTVNDYTFVSIVKLCGWSAIHFSIIIITFQSIGLRIQVSGGEKYHWKCSLRWRKMYWNKFECVENSIGFFKLCSAHAVACALQDYESSSK